MAGELELEWIWARGSLGLGAAGHFGRMAGARVGLGSLVDDLSKCGHERDSSVLCARVTLEGELELLAAGLWYPGASRATFL